MNKFAIPTILVATVMVAGMFAFMPVEQASTVHGTISGGTSTGETTANTNIETTQTQISEVVRGSQVTLTGSGSDDTVTIFTAAQMPGAGIITITTVTSTGGGSSVGIDYLDGATPLGTDIITALGSNTFTFAVDGAEDITISDNADGDDMDVAVSAIYIATRGNP